MKKLRIPHALVLIYLLVIATWGVTCLLPSGQFQRVEKVFQGKTREVPVPGTYAPTEKPWTGPEWLVLGPVEGFADGVQIIAFLFVIGGAFLVVQKTGAIEGGIHRFSAALAHSPGARRAAVPILMTVFSLGGAVFGMAEETMPFVLIFIPLALGLGYDSLVGVAIPFVGAAAGFAAAFFNPFTVGVAQGFCELPIYSGLPYRVLVWILGTSLVIAYVMRYAERVRKNPELSPVYELDRLRLSSRSGDPEREGEPAWGATQKRVLALLAAGMGVLVWGILAKQWYIDEIAALFMALGILCGLVGGLSADDIARSFVEGARDMMNPAFVIACGRAILILMKHGLVLDTVLHGAASAVAMVPGIVTAQMMLLIQAVINFFIHSGTAQAALTMPVMAPLADLVGVTRQTTVLAFQLCEFVNPILPTSAVTMGVLGMARIPWETWARWFLPLMLLLLVFSMLVLVPPELFLKQLGWWGPF